MKLPPLNKLGNGFGVFHVKKRSNQHKYEQVPYNSNVSKCLNLKAGNHIHLLSAREMIMKPGEVLCYRFLFPILGVDRVQNLTKYNRWLRVFIQLANRNIAIT